MCKRARVHLCSFPLLMFSVSSLFADGVFVVVGVVVVVIGSYCFPLILIEFHKFPLVFISIAELSYMLIFCRMFFIVSHKQFI